MLGTPAKKAIVVAIAVTAIVAGSVASAFAAPVLQPGVTSAPGMSGVCTDCHVYATPPVAIRTIAGHGTLDATPASSTALQPSAM